MKLIPFAQKENFQQDYTQQMKIDGVEIKEIKNFVADEGDFSEVFRLDDQGKLAMFPDFQLRQINRTNLACQSVKAWHFHFLQDEIWYISPHDKVVVGLWDLRATSPTKDKKMKVVLGGGNRSVLYIPKGVAHGSANVSHTKEIQLFYFVNQCFNLHQPDEYRLHWDAAGADFWLPERD